MFSLILTQQRQFLGVLMPLDQMLLSQM